MNTHYLRGIIIYVGINEYNEEIIEIIEPEIKLDMFYYSCSKTFEIERIRKYVISNIDGSIIFVNGDECLLYQFIDGEFKKINTLNANLVKRHNKGGYSANRFARIAEESRQVYITRVHDKIRELKTETNWIFGSNEIRDMVLTKNTHIKLNDGGFLDFNNNTIKQTKKWIEYLTVKNNNDTQYQEIIDYLSQNPDYLDFDPKNQDTMKYFINRKNQDKLKPNQILLDHTSKYYSQLVIFDYIGVKYFNYEIDDDIDFM